jgi:hypothetical protein
MAVESLTFVRFTRISRESEAFRDPSLWRADVGAMPNPRFCGNARLATTRFSWSSVRVLTKGPTDRQQSWVKA